MDVILFLESVNDDSLRSDRFRHFLKQLREDKFKIQSRIADDPIVKKALRDEVGSKNFIRILERIIRGATITQVNLDRLSRIFFDEERPATFIAAFERSLQTDFAHSPTDIRSAFVLHPVNGSYILQHGTLLKGETGKAYIVQNRLQSNSNNPVGDSYKAHASDTHDQVYIKTIGLNEGLSESDISRHIEQVSTFYNRERASLERLHDIKVVARFRDYATADIQVSPNGPVLKIPCLIQQYIPGITLDVFLESEFSDKKNTFDGIKNPDLWIKLARQMLKIIAAIHLRGVIHGYIRPGNFMIWKGRVYLIDFAESSLIVPDISTNSIKQSNDPYASPQHDPNSPREFSNDIYSLGATLYYMASGQPPAIQHDKSVKVAFRDGSKKELDLNKRDHLRDYVFHTINEKLLEFNEGIAHVICQCLHYNAKSRVGHVEDALRTLDLFEAMQSGKSPSDTTIRSEFSLLKKTLDSVPNSVPNHGLFSDIIRQDISHIIRRVASMTQVGRVEIEGKRDDLITELLGYLSLLSNGDRYITVTTSSFWQPNNIGIAGRFLSANKMLARRGVTIRRLFAVPKDEAKQESFKRVASAQYDVVKSLADVVNTTNKNLSEDGYYVGVIPGLNKDQIKNIIQDGYHVGIIIKGTTGAVSLSFREDSDHNINGMCIWNLGFTDQLKIRLDKISKWLLDSRPISEYVHKSS